eukprot:jgi/Hompol1/5688/HPOL_000815-RA
MYTNVGPIQVELAALSATIESNVGPLQFDISSLDVGAAPQRQAKIKLVTTLGPVTGRGRDYADMQIATTTGAIELEIDPAQSSRTHVATKVGEIKMRVGFVGMFTNHSELSSFNVAGKGLVRTGRSGTVGAIDTCTDAHPASTIDIQASLGAIDLVFQ